MKSLEEIKINNLILKRFDTMSHKDCLAHSYLFIGPKNIGKFETAISIAKMLNCEAKKKANGLFFCDDCPACLKINSKNHPDVHVFECPYGETIKIEQIRDLIYKIKLKPYESKRNIFIIKDFESVTIEASNALLKTLEEPSGSSLLLLTTSVPEKILETVKSRCNVISLFPYSSNKLEGNLNVSNNFAKGDAHFLAYFSEGNIGKANSFKENKLFEKKNRIIKEFVFSYENDAFVKEVLSSKEETKTFLDVLLSWIRDAILIKANIEDERLINLDCIDDLRKFQRNFTFKQLNELNKEIIKMYRLFAENLNIKIPFLVIKEKLWQR